MVICSSIAEIGSRSHEVRSSKYKNMAPKPHSVTNYNNKQNSILSTPSTASSQGFRLLENQDDNGSVYSLYKQKIDAMFNNESPSSINNYQENLNNSVQARIEKMFTDITKDEKLNEIPAHSFTVDYLGSIPLSQKVTSLAGLQDPLRELYFAYRKNVKHKKVLSGRLEISQDGLKVQYQGEKGDLEQLNTFPTIAVWSAVKFVLNKSAQNIQYAFLPLITDPDNINKNALFQDLDKNDQKYINNDAHSPLFAVVMRKFGVAKQLECHGFVCQTSEDAIVIAATLYKSLMAFMSRKNKQMKLPKNRNGISCISIASTNNDMRSYSEVRSNPPIRPPRKKRSTSSSLVSSDSYRIRNVVPKPRRAAPKAPDPPSLRKNSSKLDLDAIIPYPDSSNGYTDSNMIRKQSLVEDFNKSQSNGASHDDWQQKPVVHQNYVPENERVFQRAQSIRKSDRDEGILSKSSENSGDILTKVTIPRSGSFLNAKGLTKYKSTINRHNGQASGGSPLGFHELFNEFRVQEGLNSLDEILSAIIDSEGMSFNDLKPIYKEFLLKLALTLTKDELYQRSKSIMRRQKKKLMRRNSSNQNKRKKMLIGAKGLKKVFRRSFSVRFAQKFRSSKKNTPRRNSFDYVTSPKKSIIHSGSSLSTSSYDTKQFQPKEQKINENRQQNVRNPIPEVEPNNRDCAVSTSEESDFFSLRRNRQKCNNQTCNNTQNRNSSSGYVSCSECSYDSDSCTCVSADKCYCSMGQRHHDVLCKNSLIKNSLSSCKSEDKCYCSIDTGKVCKSKKSNHLLHSKTVENSFYHSINNPQKLIEPNGQYQKLHDSLNGNKQMHKYYNNIAQLQRGIKPKNRKCCYCSGDNRNPESLTWCGCDTDSCTDSNKCYCQTDLLDRPEKGTIFEQLKRRGFIPQSENLITPPSERKLQKRNSNNKSTKSSKSLEYLRNPEENPSYYEQIQSTKQFGKDTRRNYSSDNLGLDYELFTVKSNSKRKSGLQSRATNSECGGFKSVFKASDSMRSYNNERNYSSRSSDGGNNEALSVKKSAEIAALFADVKLSQTTDITHLMNSSDCEMNDRKQILPLANLNERISTHLEQQRYALLEQQKKNYREIFSTTKSSGSVASRNASVASRNSASSRGSRNSLINRKPNKSDLYSAKNGLYTIQSQSDDSRHSSANEKQQAKTSKDNNNSEYVPTQQSISSNLENSLGYLP